MKGVFCTSDSCSPHYLVITQDYSVMIRIFELFLLQCSLAHRQQKCHMLKKATRKGVSQFKTDLGVSQVEKTCKQRAPANKELIQASKERQQAKESHKQRKQRQTPGMKRGLSIGQRYESVLCQQRLFSSSVSSGSLVSFHTTTSNYKSACCK